MMVHGFGVPVELATSAGILLWLVTFVAVVPAGLALAHREHVSIRELSKEAGQEESSATTP
jgi:glycosyltransferase 2 family protein